MNKVQFTDNEGNTRTFTGLDEVQTRLLAMFARSLGDASVVNLRVRTPDLDARGNLAWADVTDRY